MNIMELFWGTKKYKGQLTDSEVAWMKALYQKSKEQNRCFLFLRRDGSNIFIEVCFWSRTCRHKFERYLIGEGHILGMASRFDFDEMCREHAIVDQKTVKQICQVFSEVYPTLYLHQYANPMQFLHQIYCTLNKQTEEIFYKSGLSDLALYLNHEIEEYNIIGTTPKSILGLPVKLLLTFNSPHGVLAIQTEQQRAYLLDFYHKKPAMFKRKWSYAQCAYFCDCFKKKINMIIEKETWQVMEYLADCHDPEDYEQYIEYCDLREKLKDVIPFPPVPKVLNLDEDIFDPLEDQIYDMYLLWDALYGSTNDKLEGILYRNYIENGRYLEYQDDKFCVRHLRSVEECVKEGYQMHNCLISYLYPSRIYLPYLVRKVEKPEEPFVDIEIIGNQIIQAKSKYNMEITSDVALFLHKYAREKNLELLCE